jgi:hypothetical protein
LKTATPYRLLPVRGFSVSTSAPNHATMTSPGDTQALMTCTIRSETEMAFVRNVNLVSLPKICFPGPRPIAYHYSHTFDRLYY